MRNIWFILKRDLKRLLRVPTAWVIIFGLTFIPALYAWFNIAGFWDPYGNTSGIRVAVANEDKGADSSLLGKMNLGDQIVGTLKKNHQLGWQFMAKAEAMECVESAHCYAAIVIPGDFSEAMANVLTTTSTLPQIDYYVNEKANAVAPKITGVGATTVDRQVNNTFVSTASSVISGIVNKANTSISNQADSSVQQALAQINKTKDNLGKTRTMIADLRTTLSNTKTKTDAAEKRSTRSPPQPTPPARGSPPPPACSRKPSPASTASPQAPPTSSTKAATCSCRRAARPQPTPHASRTASSRPTAPPAPRSTA